MLIFPETPKDGKKAIKTLTEKKTADAFGKSMLMVQNNFPPFCSVSQLPLLKFPMQRFQPRIEIL